MEDHHHGRLPSPYLIAFVLFCCQSRQDLSVELFFHYSSQLAEYASKALDYYEIGI